MATITELHAQKELAFKQWRRNCRNDSLHQALKTANQRCTDKAKEIIVSLPFSTVAAYAYHNRETAISRSCYHLTINANLTIGRAVRVKGDAICKPADKFLSLARLENDAIADCLKCLHMAEKLIGKQQQAAA